MIPLSSGVVSRVLQYPFFFHFNLIFNILDSTKFSLCLQLSNLPAYHFRIYFQSYNENHTHKKNKQTFGYSFPSLGSGCPYYGPYSFHEVFTKFALDFIVQLITTPDSEKTLASSCNRFYILKSGRPQFASFLLEMLAHHIIHLAWYYDFIRLSYD